MSTLGDIKQTIQEIAAQNGVAKKMVFDAEVVSVSDEFISIRTEDMEITEVRTCAVTDGNKNNIRIYPKVGSSVVCLDIGGDQRDIIVLQYSEIDKISIHKGEHTTVYGDLLVEQLKNLTDRVDALYNVLSGWKVIPQDGGQALKTLVDSMLTGKKSEDYSKVEDKTLIH